MRASIYWKLHIFIARLAVSFLTSKPVIGHVELLVSVSSVLTTDGWDFTQRQGFRPSHLFVCYNPRSKGDFCWKYCKSLLGGTEGGWVGFGWGGGWQASTRMSSHLRVPPALQRSPGLSPQLPPPGASTGALLTEHTDPFCPSSPCSLAHAFQEQTVQQLNLCRA